MNTKTTLTLVLLAAAVAAYLFLVEKPWEEQEQEEVTTVVKQLFDPPPDNIDRLEIKTKNINPVFEKEDDTWMMRQPIDCLATDQQVQSVIRDITELKYVREYDKDDKDRPSDAVSGLENPN